MTEILFIIFGAVVVGIIAWLFARLQGRVKGAEAIVEERGRQIQQRETEINLLRKELDDEKKSRVEALTRLEESQKNLEEQKILLETMKKEMSDTFNALSKAALESSNESFLTLASERLGKIVEETKGKLGEHQTAMDGMIKPLSDTLKRYEDQIKVMEDSRHKAYGSLEEQLRTLASTHETLQKETSNLVSALRKPQVRGRWGEMQLRRVAELSGMSSTVILLNSSQ